MYWISIKSRIFQMHMNPDPVYSVLDLHVTVAQYFSMFQMNEFHIAYT